jgi:hypothetical protein
MSTRHNDPAKGLRIVIQQGLHEEDLTGDLLMRGGYEHLCLPAEFEPDRRGCTSIGWSDPCSTGGRVAMAGKNECDRSGRPESNTRNLPT